jgi:hypothetical protein
LRLFAKPAGKSSSPAPSPKNGKPSFFEEGVICIPLRLYGRHPSSKSHGFRDFGEGPGMRIFTGADFAKSLKLYRMFNYFTNHTSLCGILKNLQPVSVMVTSSSWHNRPCEVRMAGSMVKHMPVAKWQSSSSIG